MKPYLFLITACLCLGHAVAGSFDLVTDRLVPHEIRPKTSGGPGEQDASSDSCGTLQRVG